MTIRALSTTTPIERVAIIDMANHARDLFTAYRILGGFGYDGEDIAEMIETKLTAIVALAEDGE